MPPARAARLRSRVRARLLPPSRPRHVPAWAWARPQLPHSLQLQPFPSRVHKQLFFHFILAVWELLHAYLMLCASQAPSSSTWGRCAPRGTSCPQGRTPRQSQSIPEAACSPSPRTFVYYLSA